MANEPEGIRHKWELMKERGIVISDAVIAELDSECLSHVRIMEGIALNYQGGDIPVDQLVLIVQQINKIVLFMRTIKKSDGVCSLEEGVLTLDEMVKDVLSHYFGNDLYCLTFACGDAIDDKKSFSSALVLERILAIKEFFERFKAATR